MVHIFDIQIDSELVIALRRLSFSDKSDLFKAKLSEICSDVISDNRFQLLD